MFRTVQSAIRHKRLPDFLAALGFLAIAGLLFSGLVIPLNDLVYRGDMPICYTFEYALRSGLAQGYLPQWNMFMATSLVADPQSGIYYPGLVLLRWIPLPYVFVWSFLLHVWLAGLGMYALLRDLNARRSAAIFAGIAYMLSGVMIARMTAGHIPFVHGIPWVPWVFVTYHRLLMKRTWLNFFLTVFCVVCAALTGHPQWEVYVILPSVALGLLMLADAVVTQKYRQFREMLACSAGVAALSGAILAVYILPVYEFLALTTRWQSGFTLVGATSGSLNPLQAAMLTVPLAYLEAITGPLDLHEVMAYTGVITLGLALLAVFPLDREQRKLNWLLAGLMVLAVVAALGAATPVYRAIYLVANFVRAPGRFLLYWAFCSCVLAGLGLENFLQRLEAGRPSRIGLLWLSIIIPLAELAVMLALHIAALPDAPATPAEYLSTAFGLLAGWPTYQLAASVLALWAVILASRRWIPLRGWQWVMVAGIFLDVGSSARQWATWELDPTDYTAIYFDEANAYRMLNVDPSQVRMWGPSHSEPAALGPSFGIPVIMRDFQSTPSYLHDLAALKSRGAALSASGYGILVAPKHPEKFNAVQQVGNMYLLVLPDNLPRVYATGAAVAVKTGDLSRRAISDPGFDPLRQTVVDDPEGLFGGLPEEAGRQPIYQAGYTSYTPDRLVVQVNSDQSVMVVVVEPYYPGWVAQVDGQPARLWQVNHAFRGVVVPGGEHTIVMTYQPQSFRTGLIISLVSLALTGVGVLWLAFKRSGGIKDHASAG